MCLSCFLVLGLFKKITMKQQQKQMTIHVFQTKEFGKVELLLDLQPCVDNEGSIYSEWIPQLYFTRGDLLATFEGVGHSRISIRQDQIQWRKDCIRQGNPNQQEGWQPMWLRNHDARGNVQKGHIWFKDVWGRKFYIYHIGPIADSRTGEAFAYGSEYPQISLMTVEQVEVAREIDKVERFSTLETRFGVRSMEYISKGL